MIASGAAMVFGVRFPILGSGLVNGLWLVFIGWFLSNAAVQSYRQIVIRDILEGVDVERMMRRDPPTIVAHTTVDSLVQDGIMGTDDHAFPVKEDDELVGLVTLDDIRGLNRDNWSQATVGEIMTPREQLVTIPPDEDAADALSELSNRDVRQLPVMQNGRLVGVLRRRDIVQWLQLHDKEANL
jgi:predicted transcriptional regulator